MPPCDSVSTSQVDIGKMNPELARLALEALGLAGRVTYRDGALIGQGVTFTDALQSQIRQSYAAQVVLSTARKYGWTVKQTAPFKYAVTKR